MGIPSGLRVSAEDWGSGGPRFESRWMTIIYLIISLLDGRKKRKTNTEQVQDVISRSMCVISLIVFTDKYTF